MLGISAALAVAGTIAAGQEQDRKAQEQNNFYLENAKLAGKDLHNKNRATNNRINQELQAAAVKDFNASIELGKVESALKLSAAESGAKGKSMVSILWDAEAQALRDQDLRAQNTSMTVAQLKSQKQGQMAAYMGNVRGVKKGEGADWTSIGLTAAGQALGGAAKAGQAYNDNTVGGGGSGKGGGKGSSGSGSGSSGTLSIGQAVPLGSISTAWGAG